MSYKYSKGSQVIGDLKAADDTQRDTQIDFEEDYIAFETSGSAVMVVSGSKVGIGTTTPDYMLDVAGTVGVDEYIYHNGDDDTFIKFTDDIVILKAGGKSMFRGDPAGGKIYINNGGYDVDLWVRASGSGVLLCTDAGNTRVGIGTDAPDYALDVAGDIGIDQYIYHNGDSDTNFRFLDNRMTLSAGSLSMIDIEKKGSAPHEITINNGGNNVDFIVKGNGSNEGNPLFKCDASTGRVGINGVGSPDCELHVDGDVKVVGDDPRIKIDGDIDSHPGLELYENGTRKWIVYNDYSNDNLAFKTDSNVRMSIEQDGDVGIGTTSPISKLDVAGKIAITSEVSTPSAPADGKGWLYTKSDGKIYWQSADVAETDLTSGGGGGGSSNRSIYRGFVSMQTTPRVVSLDLTANLAATANNNYKGFIIVPFGCTLDTVIVSTKGVNLDAGNTGDVTVYAYKNQDNFGSSTDVTVAHDSFSQKASGTPNIYSGIFDFSLSLSQGDLLQLKVGKSAGSGTDSIVTIVFTES